MSQHTPGPWTVVDNDKSFDIHSPRGNPLAEVGRLACGGGAEANARLIAKAPEMLDVLKDCASMLAEYIAYGRFSTGGKLGHTDTTMLEQIRALLREIEG